MAVLDVQLELLSALLGDRHAPDGRPRAQRDQARALVRVVRVLCAQITAHRRLLELQP